MARIAFDMVVCDLGDVSPGTRHTGRFTFTNAGDAPLQIAEVKKCCGVVADLDRQELSPGERGVLTVVYTSGSLAGSVARQLHVLSNDPAKPDVLLTIRAKIVLKVVCEPQRLSLLLKGENAGCPELTLTSIDNQPFSIKSFMSTDNCLTADVDTSAQATRFVLRPTANLERLQGHSSGAIRITVAHPECDRVDVPFTVLPRFGVRPTMFVETNVNPQTPIVRDFSVQSNYGEAFEVESVSSEHGSVKVLDQVKAGNGFKFKVEITPAPRTGGKEGATFRDVLYVKTKGGEKLAVIVYVAFQSNGDVKVAG
ncbi:MAG: DUF1573 domain-containing protein [Phycisphaerae bacterium]|nr:DUF1573 domain-containing protein [Phycisphaerae bacterium]